MQGKFLNHALAVALIGCLSLTAQASISGNSTDGIVAKVNDEIILKSELKAATEIVMTELNKTGSSVTAAEAQAMALDGLINEKLQLGLINRAGMVANDTVINQQLLQVARAQGLNSLSELQTKLDAERAGSYAALRQQMIQDAALQALWQNQVQSRVRISDDQVDAFLKSPEAARLNQNQYQLLHIRVPYLNNDATDQNREQALAVAQRVKSDLDAGASLDQVLSRSRQNYALALQGADTGLLPATSIPPTILAQAANLTVGQTSAPMVTANGIDVVKLINKVEDKTIVSEWQTSHILARVDGSQSNAMAEQKINALYRELQQGADFATLAATYSDDAGSAAQRGSLGWVKEGDMVPEFEAMMKQTERGDFSAPFRSQFGWHILKVDNTRQRDVTEQYRRSAAREFLFTRQAPQAQEDWLQELRSGAYIRVFE